MKKDLRSENVKKIAEDFPMCITEIRDKDGNLKKVIDFEKLKEVLTGELRDREEAYEFTWAGKRKALHKAFESNDKILRPVVDDSLNFFDTQNIYIEGDNLDVLKILRRSYFEKVKMIYIDPPYNTGHDFIYKDDFKKSKEEYDEEQEVYDEEGNMLRENKESDGRFHSNWCSMIYSRLLLARDLLRPDGVIFISIDDNEVASLRKICDEVFGEDNFVAYLLWKGRGGRQDSKYYATIHEYILCYAKSINNYVAGEELKSGDVYPKYDEQKQRFYKTQLLRKWGSNSRREDRPNLFYPILAPDGTEVQTKISNEILGCWRWSPATMQKAIEDGRIEWLKKDDEWIPYEKIFAPLEGEEKTKKYVTWIDYVGNGTQDIKELFDKITVFDYSKSINLINLFLKMALFTPPPPHPPPPPLQPHPAPPQKTQTK